MANHHRPNAWSFGLLLAGLCLVQPVVHAELPQARLTSIYPFGAPVGGSAEVTVAGVDLDDLKGLHFSRPGISAQIKTNAAGAVEANRFVVTVAPGTAPGPVDLRVWGRYGLSNPRGFLISSGPELLEAEPNNTRETAQPLPSGAWVSATSDAVNWDFYKVSASAGSRLLVEVQGGEIDSRISPVVKLLDPQGVEKARVRRDGLLEFNVVEAGDFFVAVHDHQFGGGPEFGYRLRAGQFPLIEYVWPPATTAGEGGRRWLLGRNLPHSVSSAIRDTQGAVLEVAPLEDAAWLDRGGPGHARIPSAVFASMWRPSTPPAPLASQELLLLPSQGLPVHAEDPANPVPLPPLDAPSIYAGFFLKSGFGNWIEFKAAKGDDLVVQTHSQAFGQKTDPMLVLQRISVNGEGIRQYHDIKEVYDSRGNLHSQEFDTSSTDPSWRFQPSEDGLYRARVSDGFQSQRLHAARYYMLEIRRAKPSFALAALAPAPPNPNKDSKALMAWSAFVRGGDRQPLKVMVDRRDGFGGAVRIEAEGLPSSMELLAPVIPADRNSATVILASREGESSGPWAGKLILKGVATIDGVEQSREALAGALVHGVDDYNTQPVFTRTIDELAVSHDPAEPAPVQIRFPLPEPIRTSLAAKVSIPLVVDRVADWGGKIQLRTLTEPVKEFEWDGKGTNTSFELDLNQQKLPVGLSHIVALGQASGKMRRINPAEFADHQKRAQEATAGVAEAEEKLKGATAERDQVKALLDKGYLPPAEAELAKGKHEALANQIKALEVARDQGKALAKQLTDRGNLADVSATFYSDPIPIEVISAPLALKPADGHPALHPGQSASLNLRVERLFGFAGEVELVVEAVSGIKLAKPATLKLPAAESSAAIQLEIPPDQAVGTFPARVVAQVNFNGQALKLEQGITLKVEAAPVLVTPVN